MPSPSLLVLTASLSAALAPRHGAEAPGRFELPAEGASAPLGAWGGRPLVEARTGSGELLRLLVDTGAGATLVLAADAPEVAELRLGGARLVGPDAERIDFPLGGGERIDGILGIRAFEGLVLVLDFGARRLELARGPLPADLPGAVPFRRDASMGGIPILALRVGAVEIEAHLDTGSPELLLVPSELVGRLPTRGEPRAVGRAMTPMGAAEIREVALDGALELGGLRREIGTLRIGDLPQIAGKGIGNVGSRLFEGQRLTLDLASDRLRVEPSAERTGARSPTGLEALLARIDGELDVRARLRRDGTEELRELAGRASWAPAGVGRWLRERLVLEDPERGRCEGLLLLGPTAAPGVWELVQLDDGRPSALHARGGWDAGQGALVLESVTVDGLPAELVTPPTRWIFRPLEGGGFVEETLRVGTDGSTRLVSSQRYTPSAG